MKKHCFIAISFFTLIALFSCGNNDTNDKNTPANSELVNSGAGSINSEYDEGAALIAKHDCLTCHSEYEKKTGPSFLQIADKYNHDQKLAEYLTNSVVKGSFGIYGHEKMTPHDNIPQSDIVKMVHYILSVRPQDK